MTFRPHLYAHAGDVFFTRSRTALGAAIRYATTGPREPMSWANHTGGVVRPGVIVPGTEPFRRGMAWGYTVEALWHVERAAWFERHGSENTSIEVWRHSRLTGNQTDRIVRYLEDHIGQRYGWWKLLFHLADRVAFAGDHRISRFLRLDKRPICSYLVARAFEVAGVEDAFGPTPAVAQDPDTMHDWLKNGGSHGGPWFRVGAASLPLGV
jgi:hypothetical protein